MVSDLHTEVQSIAEHAFTHAMDLEEALGLIDVACRSHPVAFNREQAHEFCGTYETAFGEQHLKSCGGIARSGDSLGDIVSRVAVATLYVNSKNWVERLLSERKKAGFLEPHHFPAAYLAECTKEEVSGGQKEKDPWWEGYLAALAK